MKQTCIQIVNKKFQKQRCGRPVYKKNLCKFHFQKQLIMKIGSYKQSGPTKSSSLRNEKHAGRSSPKVARLKKCPACLKYTIRR